MFDSQRASTPYRMLSRFALVLVYGRPAGESEVRPMFDPGMRRSARGRTVDNRLTISLKLCMFTYMDVKQPQDRRRAILEAGLAVLREQGLAGFTQPNVAARAGLRQGNLTYYFATRADLLAAVARTAVDLQLGAVRTLLKSADSLKEAMAAIGAAVVRHENTRVFVALNQAADQEPALQALFNEILEGFVQAITDFLKRMNLPSTQAYVDLLHAVFVGLSVIDLATGRRNGKARALAALKSVFDLLSRHAASTKER
jgi:AcrR family transcriptional regulator